ncbi:MAG TPA: hypothetical protein VJU77_14210 [Chthoniobacterales bacterium]|nr:hypothetical protein [Chthoniobacterales bacterium]
MLDFLRRNRFVRKMMALGVSLTGGLLLVSAVLARPVEPGPEADGMYTCRRIVIILKPKVAVDMTDLGTLELHGKTYRTASKGDPIDSREFISFTSDANGHLTWSNSFVWVSAMGAIHQSVYFLKHGKVPTIDIRYSDDHEERQMICSKSN